MYQIMLLLVDLKKAFLHCRSLSLKKWSVRNIFIYIVFQWLFWRPGSNKTNYSAEFHGELSGMKLYSIVVLLSYINMYWTMLPTGLRKHTFQWSQTIQIFQVLECGVNNWLDGNRLTLHVKKKLKWNDNNDNRR